MSSNLFFKLFAISLLCTANNSGFSSTTPTQIKKAQFSGLFYNSEKNQLKNNIKKMLYAAEKNLAIYNNSPIKAAIVPHAGYQHSGLAAASAYNQLAKTTRPKGIIILAPSHKKRFNYIAAPQFDELETPLGKVAIDKNAIKSALQNSAFKTDNDAFDQEHSLEAQLPFIKQIYPEIKTMPLIASSIISSEKIILAAKHLAKLITSGYILIATTDLLHYGKKFNYQPFKTLELEKIRNYEIEIINSILSTSKDLFSQVIAKHNATVCGATPVKILLSTLFELKEKTHPEISSYYTSTHITKHNINFENLNKQNTFLLSSHLESDSNPIHSVGYTGITFHSQKRDHLKKNIDTALNEFEKHHLLDLSRQTLSRHFSSNQELKNLEIKALSSSNLAKNYGLFSTLKTKNSLLRGCIGQIFSEQPINRSVFSITKSSAFKDPRFKPLEKNELPQINLGLTILGKPYPILYKDRSKKITLGKHGIILKKNGKSAIFLPSVPIEQNWNLSRTISELSTKAGITRTDWHSGVELEILEGFEIKEP